MLKPRFKPYNDLAPEDKELVDVVCVFANFNRFRRDEEFTWYVKPDDWGEVDEVWALHVIRHTYEEWLVKEENNQFKVRRAEQKWKPVDKEKVHG